MKTITINFKNIISELESKKLKLVYMKNGHFLEDKKGNLYSIDTLYHGSYLDRLIKNGDQVKFILLERSIIENFNKCKKVVWDALEVKTFIKTHLL